MGKQELYYLETEHGIFTNNEITGQTAEEVYQEWLENRDKPIEPQPSETEILKQEKEILAQSVYELATIIELILEGGITG